jgi:uncharacterized protein YndB with AHSA1/START domain
MPDIRHPLAIDAPPEQVYPLVASGKGFAQWWAAEVTDADSQGGGTALFNRATVYRLDPARMSPPHEAE